MNNTHYFGYNCKLSMAVSIMNVTCYLCCHYKHYILNFSIMNVTCYLCCHYKHYILNFSIMKVACYLGKCC